MFQKDNNKKTHIQTFFLNELSIKLLEWLSQSPGLNPIDSLWIMFKSQVKEIIKPQNYQDIHVPDECIQTSVHTCKSISTSPTDKGGKFSQIYNVKL